MCSSQAASTARALSWTVASRGVSVVGSHPTRIHIDGVWVSERGGGSWCEK